MSRIDGFAFPQFFEFSDAFRFHGFDLVEVMPAVVDFPAIFPLVNRSELSTEAEIFLMIITDHGHGIAGVDVGADEGEAEGDFGFGGDGFDQVVE